MPYDEVPSALKRCATEPGLWTVVTAQAGNAGHTEEERRRNESRIHRTRSHGRRPAANFLKAAYDVIVYNRTCRVVYMRNTGPTTAMLIKRLPP
jgi:hypothetical protein